MSDHERGILAAAKAISAVLEKDFPKFTQQKWEQMSLPARAVALAQAEAAIEAYEAEARQYSPELYEALDMICNSEDGPSKEDYAFAFAALRKARGGGGEMRRHMIDQWREAICARCKGEGTLPSVSTTWEEICPVCLGLGVVSMRPNHEAPPTADGAENE